MAAMVGATTVEQTMDDKVAVVVKGALRCGCCDDEDDECTIQAMRQQQRWQQWWKQVQAESNSEARKFS